MRITKHLEIEDYGNRSNLLGIVVTVGIERLAFTMTREEVDELRYELDMWASGLGENCALA